MKKSFVFAAAAAVALASCTNDESSIKMTDKLGQSEVAIYPFSKTATRGFVTGNEFFEWNFENLRDGQKDLGSGILENGVVAPIVKDGTTQGVVRDMQLSVYNVEGDCDLFIDKTFKKGGPVQSGDNVLATDPTYVETFTPEYNGENQHKAYTKDSIWHADPAIYYPIGYGDFDFLAYSVGESSPSATWNGAKEVTLEVTRDCLTDDILYGGGVQNAKAHAAAAMLFGHAQAWLTTRFTVDAGSPENVLKINKVTWQDVYASGELNIKFNDATDSYKADATWNFFTQETSNVVMPDRSTSTNKTYGANVHCAQKYKKVIDGVVQDDWTEDGSYKKGDDGKFEPINGDDYKTDNLTKQNYLDMLIPAQAKKPFVIEYTLGDQTYEYLVDNDDLTEGDWEMGTHYIYNIEFSITEITTAPTVRIWKEKEVTFGGKTPLELYLNNLPKTAHHQ